MFIQWLSKELSKELSPQTVTRACIVMGVMGIIFIAGGVLKLN